MAGFGYVTATIAADATTSGAVEVHGEIVAVQFPTLTSDSSAVEFLGSADGVTYADIKEGDGTAYTLVTAATGGTLVVLESSVTTGGLKVPFLKVRTTAAATPTAQGSARSIKLIFRR